MCTYIINAQEYFPTNTGVKTSNTNYIAFKNAKIIVSPTETIQNGVLLIKKGKIVAVGTTINLPKNVQVVDLKGKSIYPSFIDVYSNFGIGIEKQTNSGRSNPQYDTKRVGYYWNDHIMPENDAVTKFKYDEKRASELRKIGYGVVNTHIADGIIRGSGILVALKSDNLIEIIQID